MLSLARKHLASSTHDTPGVPSYDRILYAWRISRDDFRGAAAVLFERLGRLKYGANPAAHSHSHGHGGFGADGFGGVNGNGNEAEDLDDGSVLETYLLLINTLACCGAEEGWIVVDGTAANAKRRIVTLEDVRREYAAELDRRSEMLQGRFALVGDGMDVL